jgi:hypothetical protein
MKSALKKAGAYAIGVAIVVLIAGVVYVQINQSKTPIDTSGMIADESGQIFIKVRAMEAAKSCGQKKWREDTPLSLEQLAGAKVERIRVVMASGRFKGRHAPKPEEVRATVQKMWSRKFGWMTCQVEWDEPVLWYIQAELGFKDGNKGVLITDGRHVALQDHDGHNWFLE